jgi:hypothetical protein
MNWYKDSQQTNIEDKIDLDIGNNGSNIEPPDDSDDFNDGSNEEDYSSEKWTDGVKNWCKSSTHAKSIYDYITKKILELEPKIEVIPDFSSKNTPSPVERFYIEVTFRAIHSIEDNSIEWQTILNTLPEMLIKSDLWKYVGVPYEEAFKHSGDYALISLVATMLILFNNRNNNNQSSFWIFDNISRYSNFIITDVISIAKRFCKNANEKTIEKVKDYKPNSEFVYNRSLDSNSQGSLTIISRKKMGFSLESWTFKQTDDNEFTKLDPIQQENIALIIDEVVNNIVDSDEVNNLDIEVDFLSESKPSTFDSPSESPQVNNIYIMPSKDNFLIDLKDSIDIFAVMDNNNIYKLLSSIPKDFLSVYSILTSVETKHLHNYINVYIGINLLGFILKDNNIYVTVGYEGIDVEV